MDADGARRRVVVARTEVRRNRSASTVGTKRYCVLQSLKTNHSKNENVIKFFWRASLKPSVEIKIKNEGFRSFSDVIGPSETYTYFPNFFLCISTKTRDFIRKTIKQYEMNEESTWVSIF